MSQLKTRLWAPLTAMLTACPSNQPHHVLEWESTDHCRSDHVIRADPRDDTMTDTGGQILTFGNGGRDVAMPNDVVDWMLENGWVQQHDYWHVVRRWDQACDKSNATPNDCIGTKDLWNQGLSRVDDQEGSPTGGYKFLAMHRHMLRHIKLVFPKHAFLFDGYANGKVPRIKDDPENPVPWMNISWSKASLEAFEILENIEQHVAEFPTEDDLGLYIFVTFFWTKNSPSGRISETGTTVKDSAGIHSGLHAQWTVAGSPVSLAPSSVNTKNYAFWKLHGWIDDVWEKYRRAKGLTADDETLKQELYSQCVEMVNLDIRNLVPRNKNNDGGTEVDTTYFGKTIRPIFNGACVSCHDVGGQAGLSLVGSTADVYAELFAPSTQTSLRRISPGNPMNSWLYRKITNDFGGISCTHGLSCQSKMGNLSAQNIELIRTWIENGATDK